jgi:hypothetical protein
MLDLVILLSISLAVTALLGLLLAGFVWAPWLIGLLLLVLLIALMTVTHSNEERAVVSLNSPGNLVAPRGQEDTGEPTMDEPVMVYRGVKYKRAAEAKPPKDIPANVAQGKYRGQQWSR